MKLRLKNNSIRLRLTQSEVKRLSDQGRVSEAIDLGTALGGEFTYALVVDPDVKAIAANIRSSGVTVVLPKSMADPWVGTGLIGLEAEQPIEGGGILRLIIEKDFACLNPRPGEDQSDAFPHPNRDDLC